MQVCNARVLHYYKFSMTCVRAALVIPCASNASLLDAQQTLHQLNSHCRLIWGAILTCVTKVRIAQRRCMQVGKPNVYDVLAIDGSRKEVSRVKCLGNVRCLSCAVHV